MPGDQAVQGQRLSDRVVAVPAEGVEQVGGAGQGQGQAAPEGRVGGADGVADRMQAGGDRAPSTTRRRRVLCSPAIGNTAVIGSITSSHAAYSGMVRSTAVKTAGSFSVRNLTVGGQRRYHQLHGVVVRAPLSGQELIQRHDGPGHRQAGQVHGLAHPVVTAE